MKDYSVNGWEIDVATINNLQEQGFSKNVGVTEVKRFILRGKDSAKTWAYFYPKFNVLEIDGPPTVWFPVDSYESALNILKNLSGPPMLTKKALEYANRDIKDDADKLMPTNKTIAWKKRDKGDRPTCPGHPG